MSRVLLVTLAVVCVCSIAFAQPPGGQIMIFADPLGTDCFPKDRFPNVLQVYVVQIDAEGASGSQFKIETGGGFEGVFLGEELALTRGLKQGNSTTGTGIGYGECLVSPIHLLTLSYYCNGLSSECSYLEVTDAYEGERGELTSVDCSLPPLRQETLGGRTYVNANPSCPCEVAGALLPVYETTWGNVKAMYGDGALISGR